MAFLTIRIESPDRDPALHENRAYGLRKTLASLLELELKRDFAAVRVTLHDDPPQLVAAVRAPHDATKLSAVEQKFLDDLNEMLDGSPYWLTGQGAVTRRDTGAEVPGVGADWRALLRAVNAQGSGLLPGVIASIIDAAEEVEKGGHDAESR